MIIPLNQRQFNTSIYISVLVQTRTPGTIKTDKSLTKCRYNKSTYILYYRISGPDLKLGNKIA